MTFYINECDNMFFGGISPKITGIHTGRTTHSDARNALLVLLRRLNSVEFKGIYLTCLARDVSAAKRAYVINRRYTVYESDLKAAIFAL